MKKTILILFLCVISLSGKSQNSNNIWMLGIYAGVPYSNYGIDFNSGSASPFALNRPMDIFATNACISDSVGQLLFYTNGQYVANRNHDSLYNSDNFNPGYATSYYPNGLGIPQACLILPRQEYIDQYYIFHESAEVIQLGIEYASHPLSLSYSIVDMTLDSGLGGIISGKKNIHLLDDTLTWGRMTACKHSNGRDYWILAHRYYSNTFYKLLVTPDTVLTYIQSIGLFNPFYNFVGQATFSEDGTKYCIQLNDSMLELYNFDRCTGTLSNNISILVHDLGLGLLGNAFSASGRFLYACNNLFIHQFDTWAGNIPSTDQIIAQWDTFYSPGETTFYMLQLAPDHRIYVSNYVGVNLLHYIEFPDSMGIACNVVQNAFITPGYNTFSFPNIVNYDLMNDTASLCDTVLSVLIINSANQTHSISVFPNPAREYFRINYSMPVNEKAILEIYDAIGNKIKQHALYGHSKSLLVHTEDLKEGIYFYKTILDGDHISSGRILIIH